MTSKDNAQDLELELQRARVELDQARDALRRALVIVDGLAEQVTDYWLERYRVSELRAMASRVLRGEEDTWV